MPVVTTAERRPDPPRDGLVPFAAAHAFARHVVWPLDGRLIFVEGEITHKLEPGDCIEFGRPPAVRFAMIEAVPAVTRLRQGNSRGLTTLLDHARGLRLASESCSVAAKSSCLGGTMRAIVALYFVIGVVLLAIGFLLPGPCPDRNTDVVSNIVFVLTWPVGLYAEVYQGQLSAQQWLHRQACEGGGKLGEKKAAPI